MFHGNPFQDLDYTAKLLETCSSHVLLSSHRNRWELAHDNPLMQVPTLMDSQVVKKYRNDRAERCSDKYFYRGMP